MKYKNLFILFILFAGTNLFGQTSTEKPIAEGQSKFLGCAWSSAQDSNFGDYWNQLTPENAGKWGSVEGTRNSMYWNQLDAAFNIAKKFHIPFKEHTLLWGAQQPSWIGGLDSASQRMEIEQWFSLLAARYDTIEYIDVVNEPMNNAPNGMIPWGTSVPNVNYAKALGGAGKTGWDWVITSFRLARKYFPNSKLIMNEYNVINNTAATLNYIKIINLLKADSLIDGIGEQAHAFTTAGTTASTLKSNLDLLAATGVPIYLTEMDIDGPTDLAQLNEYQRVFPVFWQHPGIKGITMWGFRTGLWRNAQGAYLLTNTGVERLAMKWLKGYVNGNLILTQSIGISAPNNADSIFVGDKLKLSAVVLPTNTTIPNITWSVLQSSLATIDLSGNLIAKTAGKVTLNATSWDGSGVIGSYDIVISNRLADSIKVSSIGKRDSIYVGELLQMTAQVMPSNTSNPSYTWSISPSSLATISSNGFVNALAKGKVTVKASSNDGSDVSDSMNITILNRLIQSISLSSATNIDSMLPARTLRVIAQVLPQFATIKTILWSITPDSIASIDSEGLITGIANGKAMVEATSMDGSGVKGNMTIIVSDQTSGIRDRINPDKITVYPNPAIGGSFTVAGIEKIRLIELFDLLGKKIVTFNNINQSSLNIQINLPRGIYILNLSDGQQGFYKKIIIQ